MTKKRAISYMLFLIVFVLVMMGIMFFVRPPGQSLHSLSYDDVRNAEQPYMINEGKLPGVTWEDDIHPIFMRNRCGECHRRGEEATVEGLSAFALGLIDPKTPFNPFYSYHELVYAEGLSQIQEGERLKDGQCCWPRDFPPHKQRRIWVGHAERSVLMRKLDRDYYDWESPPRFLEEGLKLLWGLPMPWYHKKEGHSGAEPKDMEHEDEHGHDKETKVHRNGKNGHGYEVRSFLKTIFFHMALWLGRERDELRTLPPRIPERDRALLHYWINHTVQLRGNGTVIEAQVFDGNGRPAKKSTVHLIGNFNSPERAMVVDVIDIKTDVQGKAVLPFPVWSVITSFWFVSAEIDGKSTGYRFLRVLPGKTNKIEIRM